MKLSVIIPAAGSSSRMGSAVSKQLLKINGVEVLARTAGAFESTEAVEEIIIVCRDEEREAFERLMKRYDITKFKCFSRGGATRQQSVFGAVSLTSDNCGFIAIHDGARPLISREVIERTAICAEKYGAAAPGVAVKDTIKIINEDRLIEQTPRRDRLVSIQTPQIFSRDKYLLAMEKALRDGKEYTDDCALFEALGEKVYVSEGSYTNIKITTPEDISIAERLTGGK